MLTLGLALAVGVGLTLGLLGGGGSILTVPIFVYVLGFGAKPAVAMSLPVVGATSLVGAVSHWRAGHVRVRMALLFGAVAMTGAFLGARAATFVAGEVQLTLLGVVIVVAAAVMFRRRTGPEDSPPEGGGRWLPIGLAGLGVGILTGLVGIGGGFMIVPALVALARLPMKEAVGTSLVVIAMNAAAGAVGYLDQVDMEWGFVALFTTFAIAGSLGGSYLVRFASQAALRRSFAVLLLVVGGFVLVQNLMGPTPR